MVQKDSDQMDEILKEFPQIPAICLDVANGYSEYFVEFVKDVRARHPEHILMVCSFIAIQHYNVLSVIETRLRAPISILVKWIYMRWFQVAFIPCSIY